MSAPTSTLIPHILGATGGLMTMQNFVDRAVVATGVLAVAIMVAIAVAR